MRLALTTLLLCTVTSAAWSGTVFVHNVKDAPFNAKGDGITNDAPAIQAALAAAKTSGHAVYIPSGVYRIDSPLEYSTTTTAQGLQLFGDGERKTILDNRVPSGAMLRMTGASNQFQHGALLTNFAIERRGGSGISDGIYFTHQYRIKVDAVRISGMGGDGIEVEVVQGDSDGSVHVSLERVRSEENAGYGINFNVAAGRTELSFVAVRDSFIHSNVAGGIRYRGQVSLFENIAFTENAGVGAFYTYGPQFSQNLTMIGCSSENNRVALNLNALLNGRFINTQIRNSATAVPSQFAVVLNNVAGVATDNVVFDGTFVETFAGFSPYEFFIVQANNTNTQINNTRWSIYDAPGQQRINSSVSTLSVSDGSKRGIQTTTPASTSAALASPLNVGNLPAYADNGAAAAAGLGVGALYRSFNGQVMIRY